MVSVFNWLSITALIDEVSAKYAPVSTADQITFGAQYFEYIIEWMDTELYEPGKV